MVPETIENLQSAALLRRRFAFNEPARPERPFVCVVGGANVDIQGFPDGELTYRDSNVGKVRISLGGVGRNIAENLARMGVNTRLISAIGDDAFGARIQDEAQKVGLRMRDSLIVKGAQTSTYLSILDHSMDMAVAINHMDVMEQMTVDFIKSKRRIIETSALCILDTNVPLPVLEYALTAFPNTVFFLDTVSTAKARKAQALIGRAHTIKPNRLEAEILSGVRIRDETDLEQAAGILRGQGVRNVFISLGEAGIFYSSDEGSRILRAPKVKVANATGAGDAAMAGLAFGYLRGQSIDDRAKLAVAASIIALSGEDTINPVMSETLLDSKVKELE